MQERLVEAGAILADWLAAMQIAQPERYHSASLTWSGSHHCDRQPHAPYWSASVSTNGWAPDDRLFHCDGSACEDSDPADAARAAVDRYTERLGEKLAEADTVPPPEPDHV